MMKSSLIGAAALALLAGGAFAEGTPAPHPSAPTESHAPSPEGAMGDDHHMMMGGMTLEQARERAHKHAEKLDKMTPEEWEQKKKQRMERREKWKKMTPEEREKHREEMRAKRHHMHEDGGATPPAPSTPPAGAGAPKPTK